MTWMKTALMAILMAAAISATSVQALPRCTEQAISDHEMIDCLLDVRTAMSESLIVLVDVSALMMTESDADRFDIEQERWQEGSESVCERQYPKAASNPRQGINMLLCHIELISERINVVALRPTDGNTSKQALESVASEE